MHELIRTLDFDPIAVPAGGEDFVFRLEVRRHSRTGVCTGRVYRLERYRLLPCYPLGDGPPDAQVNAALIWVVDENFDDEGLRGDSAEAVVQRFLGRVRDIFGLPPEWPWGA